MPFLRSPRWSLRVTIARSDLCVGYHRAETPVRIRRFIADGGRSAAGNRDGAAYGVFAGPSFSKGGEESVRSWSTDAWLSKIAFARSRDRDNFRSLRVFDHDFARRGLLE